MIVSYNWLQSYFKQPLPTPEKLGELFTFHAFEIEAIEPRTLASGAKDTVLDVKVLPDRAHYALSHRGIAGEVSAILNIKNEGMTPELSGLKLSAEVVAAAASALAPLSIKIEQPEICGRYSGRRINGISVTPSPQWLKDRLEAVGQKSINNIVDAGNFVMFDCGQPLHVFDADKVVGGITVRFAKEGEHMTTLDAKGLTLKPDMLVIADDEGVLALAGIKGGTKAEITATTKNIIIEAAQFKGSSVRRTSTAVGIRNDSSKRFENEVTPELAPIGMSSISKLISSFNPSASVGTIVDVYPKPAAKQTIEVSVAFICDRLGVQIPKTEIVGYLRALDFDVEEKTSGVSGDIIRVTVPFVRLDMTVAEDLVEEVGRLYGYDKVPEKMPKNVSAGGVTRAGEQIVILKSYYYAEKVRSILAGLGFSEIYTPSLVKKGDIVIQNPLASDKCALRSNLTDNLVKSLDLNLYNAPLLGLEQVKVFEIGATFGKDFAERTSLVVGIRNVKGYKGETINEQIRQTREALLAAIASNAATAVTTLCTIDDTGGIIALAGKQIGIINNTDGVMELDLSALIAKLPEPTAWDLSFTKIASNKYVPVSAYPFVLRDIAVFVPEGIGESDVRGLIAAKAGDLLVRARLFDIFTKKFPDGTAKTSYAFSLVFQSREKTLGEAEITATMRSISDEMLARGWQVR